MLRGRYSTQGISSLTLDVLIIIMHAAGFVVERQTDLVGHFWSFPIRVEVMGL